VKRREQQLNHGDTESRRESATQGFLRRDRAASKVAQGGYGDNGDMAIEYIVAEGRDSFHPPISPIPVSPLLRLGRRRGLNVGSVKSLCLSASVVILSLVRPLRVYAGPRP